MTTTVPLDEQENRRVERPGAQLALIRETRGYTQEYVAGQLHLRVTLIALLEADCYEKLPQAVFVKGYIRAYAKLLQVAHEPFMQGFNALHGEDKPLEKALWQNKRESKVTERAVRWTSGLLVVALVAGLSFWWQKNTDKSALTTKNTAQEVAQENTTVNTAATLHALFQTGTSVKVEKDGV